jgi:hypothetical protein
MTIEEALLKSNIKRSIENEWIFKENMWRKEYAIWTC